MIVRAIDPSNDWTFGASLNNYKRANLAVEQNIKTRLQSFLNDCFFDTTAGIDWIGFLGGSKSTLALQLAISAVILNTSQVVGLLQLSLDLNQTTRRCTIQYQVQTSFSVTALTSTFAYDLGGSI